MNATERDDNLPGFLDVGCEAVRNDDEPHYLSILLLFICMLTTYAAIYSPSPITLIQTLEIPVFRRHPTF